jgi:hypothetical protein
LTTAPRRADETYGLALGDVVIALRCPAQGFARFLAGYFDRPSDNRAPALAVDLEIVHDETPCPVPNSLLLTKRADGDGFDIADGLIRGQCDAAAGHARVALRSTLLEGRMMRIFEQLIYQMFHTAARRVGDPALLVHAAGVARDGRGHLFVGPSGAGKSTVAALSRDHHVLNDEMNLVAWDGDVPWLVGTPFNGFFRDKRAGRWPLADVLLLEQGDGHRLEDAAPAEAAMRLAAEIVPPVGLEDIPAPATPTAMLDRALALLARVPVHRLVFRRDAGFWEVVPR